jgi:hemoglobin
MNTTMQIHKTNTVNEASKFLTNSRLALILLALTAMLAGGCGGAKAPKQSNDFFTSGSRDADQRASQRMAQDEQLTGSGEGSGEKGVKQAEPATTNANGAAMGTNQPAKTEGKLSLYERLGGEAGISNIVADFTPRVLQDPRVNWDRKGVKRGGLSFSAGKSETWNPTPENVTLLQKHLVQFLELATGGPPHYEGKEIKSTHADMHISNPEFDAVLGDLKASLDKLQTPNKEQKELLAIVESTRPLIVSER